MDASTAASSLTEFGRDFFSIAIPEVLKIDFARPELQLVLAKQAMAMIRKGRPYLTFEKIQGVVEKHEAYLFCHPDIRPAIESYLNGRVRFANSPDEQLFHLKEKHVVSFTSTVLGAGHGRVDFLRGMYRRARLMSQGKFDSIHSHPEESAFSLIISERPTDEQDSRDLLKLAIEIGAVTEFRGSPENSYVCSPMDETVKRRFTELVRERRPIAVELFRQYVGQGWFQRCVEMGFPDLDSDFIKQLDDTSPQLTDEQIASRLCELDVLERTPAGYLFGKSTSANPPLHDLLFRYTSSKPRPLSRETFVEAMMQHDDLYTRVLVDVVMAEAAGKLADHQLPPFAQTMARKWRN